MVGVDLPFLILVMMYLAVNKKAPFGAFLLLPIPGLNKQTISD
jgi:hypothetical protein